MGNEAPVWDELGNFQDGAVLQPREGLGGAGGRVDPL
jgi:hypothetical protein